MSDHAEAAHRRLAMVWIDFESGLSQVPIIARLLSGRLRVEDYRRLLFNLRQQVVDGSRWIDPPRASVTPKACRASRTLSIRLARTSLIGTTRTIR